MKFIIFEILTTIQKMGCLKLTSERNNDTLKVAYSLYKENQNNCTGSYRYGFNGMEKDDELSGNGNSYTATDWEYDSRLGRRWNVDPLTKKYPGQSPYACFNGNPILFADPTGQSGGVTIDKEAKTITITSNIMFYGNAANTQVAKQSAADIQNAWNAANGKVNVGGVEYNVKFVVTGSYMPDLTSGDVAKNTSVENNYVRVEDVGIPISKYNKGGNAGFFLTSNISKDGSTTEPHEYGHGLGLWPGTADGHPEDLNLVGTGTAPGIMYPRGTMVDAPYTYDPKKGASTQNQTTGAKANTMNPESRKVNQTDIDMLGLDKLNYKDGKANLGKATNVFFKNIPYKNNPAPTGPRKADGSF